MTSPDTQTMELEVENASFMLDTLGKDCEPLQYLRELTENAVQAVNATGEGRGEVVWDLDWNAYDADGLMKLCCIDTGIGMSAADLKRYINHLSASRHTQSLQGNFGIGAKVAAAPRNPHGIVYVSWKDGQGAMIQLWRDPATEKWGLKQFRLADGSYDHCVPVDDAVKPEELAGKDHGTMVILLGQGPDDNTIEAPPGAENRHKWIAKYLNQRYFTFPEGVEIKVREGWDQPRSESKRNFLRTIHGQSHFLDRASQASGSVKLSDAVARWWILNPAHDKRSKDAIWASTGHRAALYQDELYELVTPSRGGYQKVQEFGVRFAYSRVVIYVEPEMGPGLAASSSRSELKFDGEPLPWGRWAEEFAAKLPDEIRELEEEISSGSVEDHRTSIRERLRPLRHLYRVSRYRSARNGKLEISAPEAGGGKPVPQSEEESGPSRPGTEGGTGGNIYALFQRPAGERGEEIRPELWPEIDWVSVDHVPPTRTPPHLEDRAAHYDRRTNRIEINEDFRVFQDTMKRWREQFRSTAGAGPIVDGAVREWYAQVLIETVLGAESLRGSRHWSDRDLEELTSEIALTTAVQPRYFIEERLKRDLNRELGKTIKAVA